MSSYSFFEGLYQLPITDLLKYTCFYYWFGFYLCSFRATAIDYCKREITIYFSPIFYLLASVMFNFEFAKHF